MNGVRKHEKKARKKKKTLAAPLDPKKDSPPRSHHQTTGAFQSLKWDNKRKTSPELKNRLEAHTIQVGMNYMIEPLFIRRYKKHGLQALSYYKKNTLDISKPQFLHNLKVFYRYLKSAFCTGMALKHLRTYELRYDGIRVFDPIDQEFGLGGNKNVLIQHFKGIINEKYHRNHSEGITGFVDTIKKAFAKLGNLEETYSDRKKFQFLTHNLLVVGLTGWMAGHCESNYMGREDSFRESCKWLRSKDAQSNYTSSHNATRKARVSKTAEDTPTITPND